MRRLWLIFCQAVTVALAVLFVIGVLKPSWLGSRNAPLIPVQILQAPDHPTSSPSSPVAATASFAGAAARALPSVVHVFTSKEVRATQPFADDPVFRHFFGDRLGNGPAQKRSSGLGSGVVVSAAGYILTNNHVIEQADDIEVLLQDGRKLPARVVGRDPESDLAVLHVAAEKLPAITFGNSDALQVGDVVLAIGNPFGVGQTVTMGIVSALGRSHLGINTFENFIQTDAAINPGNSGGALIDAQGNLVGVNSAIYSRTGGSLGIGFAIPVSIARQVMEEIIKSGSVTRGWIGVEVREVTAEQAASLGLPAQYGTLITGVVNDSPADRGGLVPGDLLVGVNGSEVQDAQRMLESIAAIKPGEIATLAIRRGPRAVTLKIPVGRRPAASNGGQD